MERGLYIAATGMLAAQIRQDVIANNLANASTPGFKGDIAVGEAFRDMLLTDTATRGRLGPLSTGAQVDVRFTVLSNLDMTLSAGAAVAFERDRPARGQAMLSLKVLKQVLWLLVLLPA